MTKDQLLQRLEKAWAELGASYAGLSDKAMAEPGVMGAWSVKDILAHVTTWEEEALKYLPGVLAGRRPPRYSVMYGGIDAFNAQISEQKQKLSKAEVLRQLTETHERLIAYVRSVPEEQFATDTPFRHRLRLDTYSHYPVHSRAIRAWREERRGDASFPPISLTGIVSDAWWPSNTPRSPRREPKEVLSGNPPTRRRGATRSRSPRRA